MLVLVIVLVVANLVTLGALLYLRLRADVSEAADPVVAAALAAMSPTPASATKQRRIISVEIMNPVELAGSRGRVIGIASSFVPGLTRRLVYDQVVKEMRRLFAANRVVADVHVHLIHPAVGPAKAPASTPASTPHAAPTAVPINQPLLEPEPHTVEIAPGIVDDVDVIVDDVAQPADAVAEDQRPA